jgi:hypothetical protein
VWWNSAGNDASGCKTEHVSPDHRAGITAFIQGNACSYFGHAYVNDVAEVLAAAVPGTFPATVDGDSTPITATVSTAWTMPRLIGNTRKKNHFERIMSHICSMSTALLQIPIDSFRITHTIDERFKQRR